MAERIPPLSSPIDLEKRREELAYLEGHDADIPTDDQSPEGLIASIPKSPANEHNEHDRGHVDPLKRGQEHNEKSLGNIVGLGSIENDNTEKDSEKVDVFDAPGKENSEKILESTNASLPDFPIGNAPEKRLEKVLDPELGHQSSSTSQTETELHVTVPQDPNIVWWDGPDDPENPITWSEPLKMGNVAVISMITFITQVLQICLLHSVANVFRQTSSILNVRSWGPTSDGRVQVYRHPTCLLRRLGLHPRLRLWSVSGGSTVRALRPSPNLPRMQRQFRHIHYCLCCKQ